MTKVVNSARCKYDVYIGRPSIWGNPFKIGTDGSRDDVIAKYETWIRGKPELLAKLPELKDKILGCWCKPRKCHGDILVKLLEELYNEQS